MQNKTYTMLSVQICSTSRLLACKRSDRFAKSAMIHKYIIPGWEDLKLKWNMQVRHVEQYLITEEQATFLEFCSTRDHH